MEIQVLTALVVVVVAICLCGIAAVRSVMGLRSPQGTQDRLLAAGITVNNVATMIMPMHFRIDILILYVRQQYKFYA